MAHIGGVRFDRPHTSCWRHLNMSPSIHRYVFRREIGEGGQGIVWVVDDTELGRRIALKRVHPKHANDPLHSGVLIEESRNTGRLDHAGIVPVYDLGQDSQASKWYEETSEWIEQADGDPGVLEEALKPQ